jgi:FkbM family methyltransferase
MSFVSYAQNFEDVMLWRALKHVDQGFYIDVGANDPDIESVTKAFYERGWRGINIEPIPQWFERLQKERARDINLQLAAGGEPGEITLFEIPDTGLSTAERAFVERHKSERGYQSHELKVQVETLTNLCERYHTAPIHFLKIDVEGMEKAVLEGLDLQKIRPWIILVESTLPNSQEERHAEWEPLLLNAGYQHSYFDGLNRFYVANEHSELLDAFKAPPNVFDDFLLSRQHEAAIRANIAESKAQEAEARAAQVGAKAQEAEALAQEAETRAAQAEAREAEAREQMQQAVEAAQQAQELARETLIYSRPLVA